MTRDGGVGGTVLEELDLLGEPVEVLLVESEILSMASLMSLSSN